MNKQLYTYYSRYSFAFNKSFLFFVENNIRENGLGQMALSAQALNKFKGNVSVKALFSNIPCLWKLNIATHLSSTIINYQHDYFVGRFAFVYCHLTTMPRTHIIFVLGKNKNKNLLFCGSCIYKCLNAWFSIYAQFQGQLCHNNNIFWLINFKCILK